MEPIINNEEINLGSSNTIGGGKKKIIVSILVLISSYLFFKLFIQIKDVPLNDLVDSIKLYFVFIILPILIIFSIFILPFYLYKKIKRKEITKTAGIVGYSLFSGVGIAILVFIFVMFFAVVTFLSYIPDFLGATHHTKFW